MNGLQESTLVAEPDRQIDCEFFVLVVKVGLQRKNFQRFKTEGADLFQALEAEPFINKKVRRESLFHRVCRAFLNTSVALACRETDAPQARRDTNTFTLHFKDWARVGTLLLQKPLREKT